MLEEDEITLPLVPLHGEEKDSIGRYWNESQHVNSLKKPLFPAAARRDQVIGLEWISDVLQLKLGRSQAAHDSQCLLLPQSKESHN